MKVTVVVILTKDYCFSRFLFNASCTFFVKYYVNDYENSISREAPTLPNKISTASHLYKYDAFWYVSRPWTSTRFTTNAPFAGIVAIWAKSCNTEVLARHYFSCIAVHHFAFQKCYIVFQYNRIHRRKTMQLFKKTVAFSKNIWSASVTAILLPLARKRAVMRRFFA